MLNPLNGEGNGVRDGDTLFFKIRIMHEYNLWMLKDGDKTSPYIEMIIVLYSEIYLIYHKVKCFERFCQGRSKTQKRRTNEYG